jgi:F-type H+-transporting ATPase subunit epsilon
MKLKIVTPERVVYEEDGIEAVYANTVDGEVGILPRHVPLVSPLAVGVLRFVKAGKKEPVAVMGGLLNTNGEEVTILSDAAELAEQIDVVRAKDAQSRAEALMKQKSEGVDTQRAQLALTRSITRIKASSLVGK